MTTAASSDGTREVDDVIMGCGAGSGDHSMDIARMAILERV